MAEDNSICDSKLENSLHQIVTEKLETEELPTFEIDFETRTLLLEAISRGNVKSIKGLVKYLADRHAVHNDGCNLIHLDVKCGTLAGCVKQLLECGDINVNAPNFWNRTLLHNALLFQIDKDIVKELLHHGADVRSTNDDGDTPLHLGFIRGVRVECVRELLKHGALVNAANRYNRTPWQSALATKADAEVIKLLLQSGADTSIIDANGDSTLHLCVKLGGDIQCIEYLIQNGIGVNDTNFQNETALYHAILFKRGVEILRQLLHNRAVVRTSNSNDWGNSLLHLGIKYGVNAECVQELLKHTADVDVTNLSNQTPLHLAMLFKAGVEVVRELLRNNADVYAMDNDDNTALHLGVKHGVDVKCIEELLKYGASVDAPNRWNRTPLYRALSSERNVDVVKVLLAHNADVNASDDNDNTPLHIGFYYGVTAGCVEQMLQHGVVVNARNSWNQTLLHKALLAEADIQIIQQLLAHGADIHVTDSRGRTPLCIAMQQVPFAKLLVKYTLIYTAVGNFSNFFSLEPYSNSKNYDTVACYFKECVAELVKMKTMKVNDRFSLYNFVTHKDLNIPLYFDESTQIDTQEELIAKFPIYSDIILPRLERSILLLKLNEVTIFSRKHCRSVKRFGKKFVLNYDCTFIIAKSLSTVDLYNLMLAFCDSNLNNTTSYVQDTYLAKGPLKRFFDSSTSSCTKKARLK